MATGEIRGLRHQIRDIVGDGNVYNGLAGRPGLSFDQQRAELESIAPRVAEKAAELRARADEFEAKQAEVQGLVDQALAIVASREGDPNFESAPAGDDVPEDDFDEDDFDEDLLDDEEDLEVEEEPAKL